MLTILQRRAYLLLVFVKGRSTTMAYFELQPAEADLQQLADKYWQEASERERQLEKAAFEAGQAIREGDYSLPNLETIVRWKSERVVHYLIGNSNENLRKALSLAAAPETPVRDAVNALTGLRGIDLPIATAILSTIHPDRYAVLDTALLRLSVIPGTTSTSMRSTWASSAISPSAESSNAKPICPETLPSTPSNAPSGSGPAATPAIA